jgi:hypothetical protein
MSEVREVGKIQVEEDLDFLRKEWRYQQVGWFAMASFIVLGLAGALGRGPLSKAEAGDASTFAVSYERIIRHGTDTQLRMTAGNGLRDDTLRVFITSRYLQSFQIRDISPRPVSSGVRGSYVYFDFLRDPRSQSSEITFQLDAESYWKKRAIVFTSGAAPLHVHQSILP